MAEACVSNVTIDCHNSLKEFKTFNGNNLSDSVNGGKMSQTQYEYIQALPMTIPKFYPEHRLATLPEYRLYIPLATQNVTAFER